MSTDRRLPDDNLQRRLSASKRYWDSGGRDGAPLVMPGEDLSLLDLREQNLAGAQLQGADLRGALLDSAILARSDMNGARLTGASLFHADASKASLVDADLVGVQAPMSRWRRATLLRVDLTDARLDDADFAGAEMLDARLDRSSLQRARFDGAILLGASVREADLTQASFEGAVLDSSAFARANASWIGEPSVPLGEPARRRPTSEREFEAEVRDALRESGLTLLWGMHPGPDLVVDLHESSFVAVEVSTSSSPGRLSRLADVADVLVVPDELDVRVAMNGTPVAHLREAGSVIRSLDPVQLKPHGAVAVVIRQAARLQPYAALRALVETDATAMSRISVYLDTRQEFLLNSRDRAIARALPAHLGGDMATRSQRWVAENGAELTELLTIASRLRHGQTTSTTEATTWARRGLSMELGLARRVGTIA